MNEDVLATGGRNNRRNLLNPHKNKAPVSKSSDDDELDLLDSYTEKQLIMMENVQNAQAYVIEGDRLRELVDLYDDGPKKAQVRADLILHLENPFKQVPFPEFVISLPSSALMAPRTSPPSSALMAPRAAGMYKFLYLYVFYRHVFIQVCI